jgi:uncharacterized protein (TIGR02145 family)
MKKIIRIGGLRVLTFAILIFCLSCKNKDAELEVIPLVKPTIMSVKVENVKVNTVDLTIVLIPNEDGTKVTVEVGSTTTTKVVGGEDSVQINFSFSDLKRKTEYNFRIIVVNSAGEVSSSGSFETFAAEDFDGNLYRSVVIGDQEWLTENLRATHFSNGEAIDNITNPNDWGVLSTSAYCWYNNDISNKEICGTLYNWYVSNDTRQLIEGWHVPSIEECRELDSVLGGAILAGPKLISKDYWLELVVPATNESGFTAVPSGAVCLDSVSGNFVFSGMRYEFSSWTNSQATTPGYAWCAGIRNEFVVAELRPQNYKRGCSIRPVKNKIKNK